MQHSPIEILITSKKQREVINIPTGINYKNQV
jgi:hypothetical protein